MAGDEIHVSRTDGTFIVVLFLAQHTHAHTCTHTTTAEQMTTHFQIVGIPTPEPEG